METMNKLRYNDRVEAGTTRALVSALASVRPGVAVTTLDTPGTTRIGAFDALDPCRRPRIE